MQTETLERDAANEARFWPFQVQVSQPCREGHKLFLPISKSSHQCPVKVSPNSDEDGAGIARSASTVASPLLLSRHLWRAPKPRALPTFSLAKMASIASSPGPEVAATEGATAPPTTQLKLHGRAFYESIGSPKYIVAPMVDQSEYVSSILYHKPPVPP